MINHTTDTKSVRSRGVYGPYFDIVAVCLSPPCQYLLEFASIHALANSEAKIIGECDGEGSGWSCAVALDAD